MSSRGTVTYGVAKELKRILIPLIAKSLHHIQNAKDFLEQVKNFRLEEGEYITSFDVTVLFTLVPKDSTVKVIKNRLGQDVELHNRTL